jgi:hypothetical protein
VFVLFEPKAGTVRLIETLTQPPQTKVLVGPYDFKFKIGDNPGLKLPLWPEFFNLMQYHHTSNTTSSSS